MHMVLGSKLQQGTASLLACLAALSTISVVAVVLSQAGVSRDRQHFRQDLVLLHKLVLSQQQGRQAAGCPGQSHDCGTHELQWRSAQPQGRSKQQQQQDMAAWKAAAMQPTYAHCKRVLDGSGQVVSPPANATRHGVIVPGVEGKMDMYLVGGADIVSDGLQNKNGWIGWEGPTTTFIRDRLEESGLDDPLLVDIGANVGTHAVQVAAAGWRTLAIEAAPTNLALLRTTYCANQQLLRSMTLVGTALGNATQKCSMWAWPNNLGNGVIHCGGKQPVAGMVHMGDASTQQLDDLLAEPVHVMKMDVEGFEGQVMAGASRLLSAGQVQWLVFEFGAPYISAQGGDPQALLATLVAYGFDCQLLRSGQLHKPSLDWVYMSAVDLLKLSNSTNQMDIYCRRNREPLQPLAP